VDISVELVRENYKATVEMLSWLVTTAAALFGIYKIVIELRHATENREQELRWRKAQAAKSLNDEMLNEDESRAAMTMLDWDGRVFQLANERSARVSAEEMLEALRTTNTVFSDLEVFVRDSFDAYFYRLGMLEHSINRRLVDFEDVEHPADYYVKLLAKNRPVFENFLSCYGYKRTLAFLGRFDDWRNADTKAVSMPH